MGQPDHAPFGRRIGGAIGIAEAPGRRRHVDDGTAAGGADHRHRPPGAEELPGQADLEAAPPLGRRDLVDGPRRPGDAGIVDQRIETAEGGRGVIEQAIDVGVIGDVGEARPGLGLRLSEVVDEGLRDVANMDPGAVRDEHVRDGAADAGSAGRYHDAQPRLWDVDVPTGDRRFHRTSPEPFHY